MEAKRVGGVETKRVGEMETKKGGGYGGDPKDGSMDTPERIGIWKPKGLGDMGDTKRMS